MGIAPVPAIEKILHQHELKKEEVNVYEVNFRVFRVLEHLELSPGLDQRSIRVAVCVLRGATRDPDRKDQSKVSAAAVSQKVCFMFFAAAVPSQYRTLSA